MRLQAAAGEDGLPELPRRETQPALARDDRVRMRQCGHNRSEGLSAVRAVRLPRRAPRLSDPKTRQYFRQMTGGGQSGPKIRAREAEPDGGLGAPGDGLAAAETAGTCSRAEQPSNILFEDGDASYKDPDLCQPIAGSLIALGLALGWPISIRPKLRKLTKPRPSTGGRRTTS